MEYAPEVIVNLAQQVTQVFKAALEQRLASSPTTVTLAEVETGMRELLRQMGAQALSLFLSSGTGTPVAEWPCACGGPLHYQRQREATVTSVFGRITYERAYYAGCQCGKGYAPVDGQYGLVPGAVTAGLAALLGLGGIELSFGESRDWLKAFLLFEVAENTIRSETQAMGAVQEERQDAGGRQSQDLGHLQARVRETTPLPARLYGSLDAAKVRIEPRAKKGKKPENIEAWRDMKVGCWYAAEPVPRVQRSTRQLHYPHAVQIVDWYHAADRLKRVAQAAFPAASDRTSWLEQVPADLWAGRVTPVVQACEPLASRCEEARQVASGTPYVPNALHSH